MQFSVLLVILWISFVSESSDIDALMEFKEGVQKDPSGCSLDYWNQGSLQESDWCPLTWYGVQCNVNRVSLITLNDMALLELLEPPATE